MFVNVGARSKSTLEDYKTKKALRDAMQQNPADVELYETSVFGGGTVITGDKVTSPGVKYSVTGPNPFTSRKWYATIERTKNGNTTVK